MAGQARDEPAKDGNQGQVRRGRPGERSSSSEWGWRGAF